MIKPVEYNGEKLLVAFWWPDDNTALPHEVLDQIEKNFRNRGKQ